MTSRPAKTGAAAAPSPAADVPVIAPNPVISVRIPTKPATPPFPDPLPQAINTVLSTLGFHPAAGRSGGSPVAPMPIVQAALQLLSREIELSASKLGQNWSAAAAKSFRKTRVPSSAPSVPTPADDAATVYGDIGKWMLQADGKIANWGGLPHDGRTVLESVNVIIVDPKSESAAESATRLHAAMFWSGFPAQPFHSTGFRGIIDDVTYGQQPAGLLLGFSDDFFILPNNHGRIFGPDPVETSTGYVWSGAFSTEQFVVYDLLPRHGYVSSNMARNALAMQLIASGRATYGGMVPLNNSYNTSTTTTGDHDGYAVVVILR